MTTTQKKFNWTALIITLGVAALCGMVIVGALAAIAIPAFSRSIEKSKTAESTVVMGQIADHALSKYATTCVFPPSAQRTLDPIPEGGAKDSPRKLDESWSSYPIAMLDPTYFSYSTINEGETFTIIAEANFKPGEPHHTVRMTVSKDDSVTDGCNALIGPAATLYELE